MKDFERSNRIEGRNADFRLDYIRRVCLRDNSDLSDHSYLSLL